MNRLNNKSVLDQNDADMVRITEEPESNFNYEWHQDGRRYPKGERPDVKVSKLLQSVGEDYLKKRVTLVG
jgi:hypothetical protein